MKNISIAPSEKLKFNSKMENIFIDKILPPEALITDESRLCDFIGLFDIYHCKKILENGNGIFELCSKKSLFCKEYNIKEVEVKPTNEREEIIEKINDIFGVDVTEHFNIDLPLLFLYLQKEISKDKKIELGLI